MNSKTLRLQVAIPEFKFSNYDCSSVIKSIVNDLKELERVGANYNFKEIEKNVFKLRGKTGTCEFDIKIDNLFLTDDRLQEIIKSLPESIKIIENYVPPVPEPISEEKRRQALVFWEKVKEAEPTIGGYIDEKTLFIKGTIRGKASNAFAYDFMKHEFLYNKGDTLICEVIKSVKETLGNLKN